MMIIKGVHKQVDRIDIINLMTTQNSSVNNVIDAATDLRMCFLRSNRNANLYNAIIEVTPKIRLELLKLGRVNIDHQRVHIADFSAFTQCYKCLQFGHTKNKCTSVVEPCSHCASTDHTFKECPAKADSSKVRCFNCHQNNVKTNASVNDAHSATSAKLCPRIKALQKRITERVDYGS